ncbi:kinase-like domain-containing protein [Rhizophagus clarus]|uniref:Kinase-like domain-containing protein n=1 Tax=Rhizophagus clarus TaxID=94130 RepID=A0A8H3LYS4_9GLOM|nr:kinase-like domain-containing protein [Rhizophagus clarus]
MSSSKNYDRKCKKCDEQYANDLNAEYEWCKQCQTKCLEEFTSGNEKIDDLIQEMRSKVKDPNDILFGWISYDQFDDIEEIGNDNSSTIYSAIWRDGPLYYSYFNKELIRVSNKRVALKRLHNKSQNVINKFLNEVKTYSTNFLNDALKIYGISQYPHTKDYIMVLHNEYFEKCCNKCGKLYTNTEYKWCNSCHINYLKENFTNSISGNEEIDDYISGNEETDDYISIYDKIDNYIQEMQLKINNPCTLVFEWIPYDQFNDINEIGKGGFATIYLAIWNDGPLHYEYMVGWTREPNKKVTLKCLDNINEFLNEVKTYSIDYYDNNSKIYGISQNPNTKDYIMVLQNEYCEKCVKCGIKYVDTLYNWCNLCQINDLKNNFSNWTTIWKDGPLSYSYVKKGLTRLSDKEVVLKSYYNSQVINNEFLDEIKKYSNNYLNNVIKIYGITKNPDTENYIMVFPSGQCEKCGKQYIDDLNAKYEWCKPCQRNFFKENFTKWTSGNENINNLIRETQLKIHNPNDIVFEWIPYNQFNNIKEIGTGGVSMVFSAVWKDGPLYYNYGWSRKFNKKVALKRYYKSEDSINTLLNEIKAHFVINSRFFINLYGISQDLVTKDYIMVLDYAEYGNLANWVKKNYEKFSWSQKLKVLLYIIQGLKEIHQKQMIHCCFNTGTILVSENKLNDFNVFISGMGLCKEVGNVNNRTEEIYGVTSYLAPEVLNERYYTQAADIYSFGMIMYFVATGKQPFDDDQIYGGLLVLRVCNGIRPEINEPEAPKCYIDLMIKCWDQNPDNRPNANKIEELINLFNSPEKSEEIKNQFEKAEEYRKLNLEKSTQTIDASPTPSLSSLPSLPTEYDSDDSMKIDFTQLKLSDKED